MDTPPVVPTPLRDFLSRARFKFMHSVVFLMVCFGIVLAWKEMSRPLSFPGQAEIVQANLTAPESGLITGLTLDTFQAVKAGDVLGQLAANSWRGSVGAATNSNVRTVPLRAPISGVVTVISHRSGETVAAGESVLTITAQETQRILGYVPASFPTMPQVGMQVEIKARSRSGRKAIATVIGISPQWQSITNMPAGSRRLAPPNMFGRPVAISLPPGLPLVPGEPVEITLLK